MFAITEIMANVRRTVHGIFSESATYMHPVQNPAEVGISVRWHNRVAIRGNLSDEGYSDIIEGVNRVFFNTEELDQKSLVLHKGGRVTLTDPANNGTVLILDSMEPRVGPLQEIWNVGVV